MEHMDTSLHDLIMRTFATLEAKDLDAMMSLLADDAVVIDPHFPTPRLQGKAVINDLYLFYCPLPYQNFASGIPKCTDR